jgi:hypothetical protein
MTENRSLVYSDTLKAWSVWNTVNLLKGFIFPIEYSVEAS